MTREEAKEILTNNWTRVDNPNYAESELDEAVGMAIEALQTIDNCDQCEWCCPSDGIPTIHVVRCKDCKHYKKINPKVKSGMCYKSIVASAWNDDGFCSWGERKGGDDE